MKILIIEDREEVASLYCHYLRDLKCEVVIAWTMEAAMEIMREIPPPDLVFLDLRLPDTPSEKATLEMVGRIKAYNENLVLVIITGVPNESLPAMAFAMGADAFQFKLRLDSQTALLRAVKEALGSKKYTDREKAENSGAMVERIGALIVADAA